ncbi:unnamed protein product [Ranitomeya imitator]|uniref:PiggyBac transposable element-derived protein domain-containing protein n=1 Tax=Ranitomeya imitator TaxID=111125 RepID=A0ABN9MJI7_9NEOB|nr:unnamed protein product [Ranitomeya imitator]
METGIGIPTTESGEEKPYMRAADGFAENVTPAALPPCTAGDAADFQGSSASEAAPGARCKVCLKEGAILTCNQCVNSFHRDCHLPAMIENIRNKMQKRHTIQQALELILSNTNPSDSDGEDLVLQPDSDSELSSDEETPPLPKKRARLASEPKETAKDGTVWREVQVGKRLHFTPVEPYPTDGEPSAKARRSVQSRLQSFLCFITLDMLCSIQEWTTQHARHMEQVDWFMGLPELMAFISVIILRGLTKVPSLRDSWSANLGNPRIIATMTRNRFQDIMQHLRFDDMFTRRERVETDKFAAISDVWRSFVTNCIASYNPGRHITIDEQLFPSKTRCCFLQYIATKPDKFGIKFWVACDLKSKYICNVLPYLGKDPSHPSGERLSETVVMRLMEPFMDKGRTVTTNNLFTSLSLAQRLLSRKTTILGTVSKSCREIPQSARQMDHTEFTTQVFSTTGATLTVYAPKRKKAVYILSSMHSVVETENTNKRKPNTVTQYNHTKCGVDVMDQMVREYSVRAGTRRWPVAVFYNMIDMAALNAMFFIRHALGWQERRVDFLVELAKELGGSHVTEKKARMEKLLRQQPSKPSPGKRAKCQVNHRCTNNCATERCVDCYKYTCGKCTRDIPRQCQAKRTGKSKHKQCAICTEPLPDSYLKSLCQACIDNTLRQEESVKMNEIRLIIREELQSLGGGSSSVNIEKRSVSSPKADTSAESGEVDSDVSQLSNSSEEEDFVCFPTEGINNLVKSVRNTMGVSESKEPQTPQEVMFAGLSQQKGHVFPVNQAIKDLVKKEWTRGQKGFVPISCKRRYPFDDEDLNTWAKIPKVDAAVAYTSRRFSLPLEDAGSLSDPMDRKSDALLKKSWEACVTAFKPAISARCTSRSMLVWLEQLDQNIKWRIQGEITSMYSSD